MKKLLLAAAALTGLYSCSEDFDVAAPYQNYTFAYSVLDMRDTAHYIRIQKAFLDENKNAIDMAREADSNFYRNLNVYILELSATGAVLDSIAAPELSRVNMDLEGYPKDSGTFFTQPNYAYKFKKALNPNNFYRLVINNPETGSTGRAQIKVLDTAASEFSGSEQASLDFSRTTNPSGRAPSTTITSVVPDSTAFASGYIRFRYVEDLNGVLTDKFVDFPLGNITRAAGSSTSSIGFEVLNINIYSYLASAIGPANQGVVRYLDSCDIVITAGGKAFYDYTEAQQNSSGLTGDLSRPLYTNFSGSNIYGFFSTRASKTRRNISLGVNVRDSLRNNPITNVINFADAPSPR